MPWKFLTSQQSSDTCSITRLASRSLWTQTRWLCKSTGCRSVHQHSLQKHDHLVEIQHLHFQVLGAERRTFVCTVDISPFKKKTTWMQFAAHVLWKGGMELELKGKWRMDVAQAVRTLVSITCSYQRCSGQQRWLPGLLRARRVAITFCTVKAAKWFPPAAAARCHHRCSALSIRNILPQIHRHWSPLLPKVLGLIPAQGFVQRVHVF